MQHYLGLQFCNLQPIPKVLFKQGFHFKPSPQAIYTDFYGHEVIYVDVINKCVIFYIRMKTANDFNKHLEKFKSGMS